MERKSLARSDILGHGCLVALGERLLLRGEEGERGLMLVVGWRDTRESVNRLGGHVAGEGPRRVVLLGDLTGQERQRGHRL